MFLRLLLLWRSWFLIKPPLYRSCEQLQWSLWVSGSLKNCSKIFRKKKHKQKTRINKHWTENKCAVDNSVGSLHAILTRCVSYSSSFILSVTTTFLPHSLFTFFFYCTDRLCFFCFWLMERLFVLLLRQKWSPTNDVYLRLTRRRSLKRENTEKKFSKETLSL